MLRFAAFAVQGCRLWPFRPGGVQGSGVQESELYATYVMILGCIGAGFPCFLPASVG